MKADSRLIKKESKIAKEKVYQFVLEGGTTEDIKSMSLKKAVKSFQNKYDKLKIAKVYYVNKKGHRLLSIIKLKTLDKEEIMFEDFTELSNRVDTLLDIVIHDTKPNDIGLYYEN